MLAGTYPRFRRDIQRYRARSFGASPRYDNIISNNFYVVKSERGESNPRILLGRQAHYHCATLAILLTWRY